MYQYTLKQDKRNQAVYVLMIYMYMYMWYNVYVSTQSHTLVSNTATIQMVRLSEGRGNPPYRNAKEKSRLISFTNRKAKVPKLPWYFSMLRTFISSLIAWQKVAASATPKEAK